MSLVPVETERRRPAPDPADNAPFPGPEWEEEDDLSVEWDEDWAWDEDGVWDQEAAQAVVVNSANRGGTGP